MASAKVHNIVTAQRGASSALFLIEVPVYHIVIELDAVDGTELGDDRQNVCLLFGRELVLKYVSDWV